MTRSVVTTVGLVASVSAPLCAQPLDRLETLAERVPLTPLRIAPAAFVDGEPRMIGGWTDYAPAHGQRGRTRIFDCFEQTGDCSSGYFFFGTGYCNMFLTDDMTLATDTSIGDGAFRVDFAWFWTADGSFTSERCIIAVFTQETDPNDCETDSFDYSGWILDYGTLVSGVGAGYYTSNVSLTNGVWPLPQRGVGSYAMFFLRDLTSSGAFVMATCAQPMLWATGEDRGDPFAPGTQGPRALADTEIPDGSHTSSECFSFDVSFCPFELGGALAFWGYRFDDCFGPFPNCDGNRENDTRDFVCFLSKWSAAFQSGVYDAAADCDYNGSINTQDFLCFLGLFASCF